MRLQNIEDSYPLSPMQEGLLFHSLAGKNSGVYVTHITCVIVNLNLVAFQKAWQKVVERHPALRTAFVWENLDKPLQVVGRNVRLPLELHDWREFPALEQASRLRTHIDREQNRDFKLSKAPLVRLTLFQLSEDTFHFLYSHHHILLDGWSDSLLLKEVFAFYEAFHSGQELFVEQPRPYRDYVSWLQQQSLSGLHR